MMKLRTLSSTELSQKPVLTRVDFNVPLKSGEVADATRIQAALPTIIELAKHGARVILCSHLGRPKGQVVDGLRLDPVAPVLQDLLRAALQDAGLDPYLVIKLDDCIGPEVAAKVAAMGEREVLLLENLRFYEGETKNDPSFVQQLASLADAYVSDAFGTVHRAHASTEGVAHLLPAYAGLLVQREVAALSKVTASPEHPMVIALGGAKISGKIEVLENLLPIADTILIGGAMANTFLKAQGHNVGASLVEDDMLETASRMATLAKEQNTKLLLPVDYVVTDNLESPQEIEMTAADGIGPQEIAVDIGKRTREIYAGQISQAQTVFWNGPMGVFERDEFSEGTLAIAEALAALHGKAHTVVGGGESVTAVNRAGVANQISHVSTGGGASLEFVAGRKLPGLAVLES
jgi:phosphoglycerate kinase